MTTHEAKSLANLIKYYTFLSSLVIWYDVLLHINVVSKSLQSITTDVSDAICMIRKTKEYFEKSRTEDKFKSYLINSKELASELELEDMTIGGTITARRWKKPKQFTYKGEDEPVRDPKQRYKVEFYFHLLDIIIASLDERLTQLKSHSDSFDFLYDISSLKDIPRDVHSKKFSKLSTILQDDSKDLNSDKLCDELKVLSTLVTPGIGLAETLKFIE
ncbi:hypothetical protein PR048_005523 [Dryococelus australis]|uniref:Uncharacterized protein n=1 Tax=Dryococelus australis TaxID=614101 RepID=A0ABQ9I901_9NEOP|nr:hypothetical protein PR048_005523 [Dryococelus australis]